MSTRSVHNKISLSIVFLILSFLFSTISANAQSAPPSAPPARSMDSTRTPEGRAAALTEKMKTELPLTVDQYPSVQAINLKYALKNERIFKGFDGKFAKYRAIKSSQKDKGREMKAILTSGQYKKYEEMMKEMTEEFKNRRK
ncbi:MAG TPA: hypothetical protein VGN00_12570 [Puia sp.]